MSESDLLMHLPIKTLTTGDNVRSKLRDVPALAKSIGREGLFSPVLVRRLEASLNDVGIKTPAAWELVCGHRRLAAAKRLGWETIPALAWSADDDENASEARTYTQLRENLDRADLSTFDIAQAAHKIATEHNRTAPQVARRIGLDKTYVASLIRALKVLDPIILHDWRDGHPAATTPRLFHLCSFGPEKQVKLWQVATGSTPAPAPGSRLLKTSHNRPTVPTIEAAISAIRDCGESDEWKQGALSGLRYAAGHSAQVGRIKKTARRVKRGPGRPRKIREAS